MSAVAAAKRTETAQPVARHDVSRPALGVGLAVLATLLFAGHDAMSKHLLASYDVPLVAAVRYLGHTLLMLALLGPSQGRDMFRVQRKGLVAIRSVCLVIATLFMGWRCN